jgi:hypothetical protein
MTGRYYPMVRRNVYSHLVQQFKITIPQIQIRMEDAPILLSISHPPMAIPPLPNYSSSMAQMLIRRTTTKKPPYT